jgi:hypothetical protein
MENTETEKNPFFGKHLKDTKLVRGFKLTLAILTLATLTSCMVSSQGCLGGHCNGGNVRKYQTGGFPRAPASTYNIRRY